MGVLSHNVADIFLDNLPGSHYSISASKETRIIRVEEDLQKVTDIGKSQPAKIENFGRGATKNTKSNKQLSMHHVELIITIITLGGKLSRKPLTSSHSLHLNGLTWSNSIPQWAGFQHWLPALQCMTLPSYHVPSSQRERIRPAF